MPQKMKRGKFRVATAGAAIDGREIKPEWLTSIAKNYSPETRPAFINLEHINGVTGKGDFRVKGEVLSVETKKETLQFGDKTEERQTLWAEVEANEDLLALNTDGQKLHTSIEVWSDFNNQEGEYYLGGIAITDNPASFHTSRLQFSSKPNSPAFSKAIEFDFTPLETEQATDEAADKIFSALVSKIQSFFTNTQPKQPPEASDNPATPSVGVDLSALQATLLDGFKTIQTAFNSAIADQKAQTEKVEKELSDFKAQMDKTPAGEFTPRTVATGDQPAETGFRF